MNRFFVPPSWITEGHARLTGEVARQISRVLRMSPGDEITLLDNTGMEYLSRLSRCAINTVEAEVLSAVAGRGEPFIQITLYQGILKGDKFQWVLQKGTELGVANFVPIVCKRSVPRQRDGRSESRYPRWRKIIAEAAEQSGRSLLPTLGEPVPFEEACRGTEGSGLSIIPWENERATGLRSVLMDRDTSRVRVFIGPEGGFQEGEVELGRSHGVVPVSLGRRILRSETAAIATVAAVLYEVGDLSM